MHALYVHVRAQCFRELIIAATDVSAVRIIIFVLNNIILNYYFYLRGPSESLEVSGPQLLNRKFKSIMGPWLFYYYYYYYCYRLSTTTSTTTTTWVETMISICHVRTFLTIILHLSLYTA